jgi:signal transduction histidine kinase/ligand-binding sensor domain-containing protein
MFDISIVSWSRGVPVQSIRSLSICVLLLFFVGTASAIDPGNRITQYAHTAWRVQDGFFSGAPIAFAQTRDGYLWIGTEAGLLRFDGVRFVPWTPPEGSMLRTSTGVYSLLGSTDGSLWIGTAANLFRIKDGNLISYTNATGRFNSLIEDRDGIIWAARTRVTDGAGPLCQVVGIKLRCYGKADGISFPYGGTLADDLKGDIWIGGESKFARWSHGISTTYDVEGLKPVEGSAGLEALAANPDGSLWVGMNRHGQGLGLQHWMQGAWKPFSTPELDTSTLEVSTLFMDRGNSLWIGTGNDGIYRIHDGKADRFSTADGLSSDQINGFFEDREGDMWVATSKGIDRFRDLQIASYSRREGLSADRVASVSVSQDHTVWIGNNDGLDSLRQGAVSSIGQKAGLPGHRLTVLYEDHDGLLWVGVDNGLYVYEKGKFNAVRRTDGAPIGMIIAITGDTDSNIWAEIIGQPPKLVRIQNRKIQEEIPAPRIPQASSLAADLQSGIWLGLADGTLARYRKGQLETFSTFGPGKHVLITSVLVNSDGSVFGGSSHGLIEWRSGKVQTLTTRNGLPCDRINAAIFDSQNALWLYMQCGLISIPSEELQKWWEHPATVIKFRLFDALDGVRASSSSFSPREARSFDGRLWFANGNVLQMIEPDHLLHNSITPPVHIEAVKVDGMDYLPGENLRLPPLVRNIEVDYTALSLTLPQRVLFRYRLEGHDRDWQEPGTRRQAFYSDLKPGKYRFQVIACNNDGVWNNVGTAINLTIAPAWFQTYWFFALCVATAVLIVWAFYQMRLRQVAKAMSVRFDERLSERTRIARDLHDTLLQTIQGSKLVADSALKQSADLTRMQIALEQVSTWLGRATDEGREALNSLRTSTTETNDLAAALQRGIEECRIENSMEALFSVVGDIREMHPLVRDEVYRIAYEAIRNACVHSQASRLEVTLTYADELGVRIADNGVGIEPLIADRGKEGHFGLRGMRERAQRIVGKLTVTSSPGSGTEVKLTVPGKIIYRKTTSDPHRSAGKKSQ